MSGARVMLPVGEELGWNQKFPKATHMITRESFVDRLAGTKDVNEHYAFINANVARGHIDTLRDLFRRIQEQCSFGSSDWAPRAVSERIVESLALADGYGNASSALELARTANDQDDSPRFRPAVVISKLVAGQSSQVIDRLLNSELDLETTALILHEAVVRKKLLPRSPAAQAAAERLTAVGHPLSVLPLALLDVEAGLLLRNYRAGSSGTAIPFGPFEDGQVTDFTKAVDSVGATETTTQERANRISATVRNWEEESNGRTEARTFHVARGALSRGIAPILPRLGLECVRPAEIGVFHEEQSVARVFIILFSAASTGGAYNWGLFAAYGRLAAWQSLGGLAGCSKDASIEDISHRAAECDWCVFSSSGEWYYQVAWDIGIACAAPAQNELAILAATDTD